MLKSPTHFLYPLVLWIELEVKDVLVLLLTWVGFGVSMDFTLCAATGFPLRCHFSLSLIRLDWRCPFGLE